MSIVYEYSVCSMHLISNSEAMFLLSLVCVLLSFFSPAVMKMVETFELWEMGGQQPWYGR
jgi:hypothetical protein